MVGLISCRRMRGMTDAKDIFDDERGPAGSGGADKDTSTKFSLLRILVPCSSSSRRGISTCYSNSERCILPFPPPLNTPLPCLSNSI